MNSSLLLALKPWRWPIVNFSTIKMLCFSAYIISKEPVSSKPSRLAPSHSTTSLQSIIQLITSKMTPVFQAFSCSTALKNLSLSPLLIPPSTIALPVSLFSLIIRLNISLVTGVISITEINQLTSVIQNNKFDLNVAVQSGGVIWAMYLRQNTNTLNVINNTFTNNFCQGTGGVYYIVLTNLVINLSNNTYISNSATISGGVGYISRSDVSVTENNSNYSANSAGSYGGAWYLNLKLASTTSPRYTISNVQFIQSTANQSN